MKTIQIEQVIQYTNHLINEEKAESTIKKYIRDIMAFIQWVDGRGINKKQVLDYKQYLIDHYAPISVNSILSALNSFFSYLGRYELRVKFLKIQKQIFARRDKELTKEEYQRLLRAAKRKNNRQLDLLMQTICSTGIRVSELRYITAEAIRRRQADIRCKGKIRMVILPDALCKMLIQYCKEKKITSGSVFVTKNGKPLDRSNIWRLMKNLCADAGVSSGKVFPHNLRHLFARTYYSLQKDIVRLADILGHSSVETTRIYTIECGDIHRRQLQKLGLLLC